MRLTKVQILMLVFISSVIRGVRVWDNEKGRLLSPFQLPESCGHEGSWLTHLCISGGFAQSGHSVCHTWLNGL